MLGCDLRFSGFACITFPPLWNEMLFYSVSFNSSISSVLMSDRLSKFGDSGGVQYSCDVVLLVTEFSGFVCTMFTSWCSVSSIFFVSATCMIGSCVSWVLLLSCTLFMLFVFWLAVLSCVCVLMGSSCCVCCGAGMIEINFACSLSSLCCSTCMALDCACLYCLLMSVSGNITCGLLYVDVSPLRARIFLTALPILRVDLLDTNLTFLFAWLLLTSWLRGIGGLSGKVTINAFGSLDVGIFCGEVVSLSI